MEMEKNKPELKLRAGALTLTIWSNEIKTKTGDSEYKTFSLSRSYRAKDGSWKNTNNFRMSDIPKAMALLRKAYEEDIISVEN